MNDKQVVETSHLLPPLSLCQILRSPVDTKSHISNFGNWRVGFFKDFMDNNQNRPFVYFVMLSLKNSEAAGIRLWPTTDNLGSVGVFYRSEQAENRIIRFSQDLVDLTVNKTVSDEYPNYSVMIETLKLNQPNFKLIGGEYVYHPEKSSKEYQRRLFIYNAAIPREIEWSIFLRDGSDSNNSIFLEYEKRIQDQWFSSKYACIQLDLKNDGILGKHSRAVHLDKFWGTKKHKIIEFDEHLKKDENS
jgi:hypothetical protein